MEEGPKLISLRQRIDWWNCGEGSACEGKIRGRKGIRMEGKNLKNQFYHAPPFLLYEGSYQGCLRLCNHNVDIFPVYSTHYHSVCSADFAESKANLVSQNILSTHFIILRLQVIVMTGLSSCSTNKIVHGELRKWEKKIFIVSGFVNFIMNTKKVLR